ncbi:enoyl-CoA hydratase-related protein [Psychrobacillus sp. NPDC096623]|uniref:enoyl-CoA hydratase-related protein n=1 Tax=Psychrobacillus sp. NPDC096623 TaxID=3364492 RepID=UPI00380897F2
MPNTLLTKIEDGIMTITLNRPDQLNAFNVEMMEELISAYEYADSNNDVRVIIVTGNGRAFCAGMDLASGDDVFASNEPGESFRDTGGRVSMVVHNLKKPVIAAINGAAVGIGITMTLPMDIRIVKKDAKIGFVFGRRGIGPEAASGWFLPKIVGISKAIEWVLTGRMLPTSEMLEAGLVQYEVEDPYTKALEIARDIADNTSSVSNAFSRKLLWNMLGSNHPMESHLLESKFLHWVGASKDAKEGINSFMEKRPAKFEMNAQDLPDFFEGGNHS